MSAARPKSKLDLLVRVRYQNPIPPPTLPPLLVDIPTPVSRIADPNYMRAYSTMAPHPMMLDSEMGSRVDLNLFEGIWGDDRDQVEALNKLNPKTLHHPSSLHPTDALLLLPAATHQSTASSHNNPTLLTAESLAASAGFGGYHGHGGGAGASGVGGGMPIGGYSHGGFANKAKVRPEESWLRQTTYISKERSGKQGQGAGMAGMNGMAGLGKRETLPPPTFLHQIQQIEKTFYDHDSFILPGEDPTEGVPAIGAAASGAHERKRVLRHPGKPRVRAVEVFDVLPDEEAYELAITKIDFQERPSEMNAARASDAQILSSLVRPQTHNILEYYMPDQENADRANVLRETDVRVYPDGEEREYADIPWTRDYSNADRGIDPTREILLMFEDGIEKPAAPAESSKADKDDEDEDDDDDIFGEKALEAEEKREEQAAKKEEKKRPKGVYWMPIKGRVVAKRKRVPKGERHERSTDVDVLRVAFIPQSTSTNWYTHVTALKREEMSDPAWIDRKLREGEMGGMMETEGEAVGADEDGVMGRD